MITYLLPCVLLLLPMVFTEMSGDQFVEELNEKRSIFAEKNQITNMRTLSWYQDLAVEVVDSWDKKGFLTPTDRYHAEIVSYEDLLTRLNNVVNQEKLNSIKLKNSYLLYFLAPLHNEVGCATPPDDTKTQWYCYFSPVGSLDGVIDSYNVLGQGCDKGYYADNGLCKLEPTTTSEPTTAPKPTIIDKPTQKPANTTSGAINPTANKSSDDATSFSSSTVSCSFIETLVFFSFSFLVLFD